MAQQTLLENWLKSHGQPLKSSCSNAKIPVCCDTMASNKARLSTWLNAKEAKQQLPPKAWELISLTGSLTKHLRQITDHVIEHRLLFANWRSATPGEQKALRLADNETTWIRDIEWRYHNRRWVYARVVIPQSTITATQTPFPALGVQSLGEILFVDNAIRRDAFCFLPLDKNNSDYPAIASSTNDNNPPWARRCVIYHQNAPLLITEIFFPEAYARTTT
jgi:chorismate lyase